MKLTKLKRNPKLRRGHRLTPQEREDARDVAYMKRHNKGPFYSFRKFVKDLGYEIHQDR